MESLQNPMTQYFRSSPLIVINLANFFNLLVDGPFQPLQKCGRKWPWACLIRINILYQFKSLQVSILTQLLLIKKKTIFINTTRSNIITAISMLSLIILESSTYLYKMYNSNIVSFFHFRPCAKITTCFMRPIFAAPNH